MNTQGEYHRVLQQLATLKQQLAERYAAERPGDTQALAILTQEIQTLEDRLLQRFDDEPLPKDSGLSGLIGLGEDTVTSLDDAPPARKIAAYDDNISAQRLYAVAHLYYLAQQERAGVFDAVMILKEKFMAGQVRLSSGQGALLLYQYDRKRVLQYSRLERMQAYSRVFGYTNVRPAAGARTNVEFQRLFTNFNKHVAKYFRDKRISDVVSPDSTRDSFGSVAAVKQAGRSVRDNAKKSSYGNVNVVTLEVSQLLDSAFKILGAEDVRNLFGADDAWDVLEAIQRQFIKKYTRASDFSRLGEVGRNILLWLSESYITNNSRSAFEANLGEIAEDSEEWLTVSTSLGEVTSKKRNVKNKHASNVVPLRRRMVQ